MSGREGAMDGWQEFSKPVFIPVPIDADLKSQATLIGGPHDGQKVPCLSCSAYLYTKVGNIVHLYGRTPSDMDERRFTYLKCWVSVVEPPPHQEPA
jgi:hypothetical protein